MQFNIKKTFFYKLVRKCFHGFQRLSVYVAMKINKGKQIQVNKIVIDNFAGRGFGDNPKYIVKALLNANLDLDIVWLVNDLSELMPQGVRKVKYGSLRSINELATAKIWIDNIKNSVKPDKQTKQFYLQTWHGGIALKGIEGQVEDKLDANYINASKRDASMTDLMLSDSEWTTNLYSKYFWYKGPIFESGFPRNDILINNPSEIRDKIFNFYKIPKHKKIILYAPTFRDGEIDVSIFKFRFNAIIAAFEKKFENDYCLLVRVHPNVASYFQDKHVRLNLATNYINANNYPDMQELLLAMDVLITDYSSSMFDAMLASKKVFLLAKDLKTYSKSDRTLLFDIKKDLPFSFSENEEEIIKNINSFKEIDYLNKINNFKAKLGLKEDGKASEKVAKLLINKINEAEK